RPRAGSDRIAGRHQYLRPRRGGADLFGSSIHGRRPGRIGRRRRCLSAAVANVRGEHLGRAVRAARAGARHREGLCAGLRWPRPASGRARPARQRAQARRRRTADARLGLPGRRRHRGARPVRWKSGTVRARRGARRHRRDHPRLRHRSARLDHDRSGDRRSVPLRRLRLRLALRAAARGDRARSCRGHHHGGSCRARLWRDHRRRRQARHDGKRAPPHAGHCGGVSLTRRVSPLAWAIAPAALLFVLFFILPFGVMAMLSFLSGNPVSNPNVVFTWRHYNRLLENDLYFDALIATLRIGAITTIIALLIGYPLAHWMARMHSRVGHAALLMAVVAPLLTGIVVRTFAWMTVLGDRGVINITAQWLGLTEKPLPLMYNEFGVIVGLVHIYVPFMVLTLVGVIGRIDRALEDAARGLGASRFRTFLEVTLPLSLPGILAGSLLVFALAISAYVTPVLLGGNNVLTLPMLIYQQVSASFNLGFAGALGVVLLAVSLALVFAYNTILGRLTGERQIA